MSLQTSEGSEILPGSEGNAVNATQNVSASQFKNLLPSTAPTAAPAATAATAATAAPMAKKGRSEKQAAADAGAKKILDEVLVPRYASEFADIDVKFRPKAKPLVARQLFYTADSAKREAIIKAAIAKDRAAAQVRVNGKTRKNTNKAAKAAASLAEKEARVAAAAAERSANPPVRKTRRLKEALDAASSMAAPSNEFATTRRVDKVPGVMSANATRMKQQLDTEAGRMKTRLHAIATRAEAALTQTARRIADDIRKAGDKFTETSSRFGTTRKRTTAAAAPVAAAAAAAPAVANQLSAIPEVNTLAEEETAPATAAASEDDDLFENVADEYADEKEPTPNSSGSREESDYFG